MHDREMSWKEHADRVVNARVREALGDRCERMDAEAFKVCVRVSREAMREALDFPRLDFRTGARLCT